MELPKLITILGPTASGKTKLAVKLAKRFNGEIVSADSRQVYKGMNIGTGKATKQEMKGVPHYLIDIIRPDKEFNVAIFKELATKGIRKIHKKKKLPFLVGGTGLYINSVVNNIVFPKVGPKEKLRKTLERKSAKELFQIYKNLDGEGAKRIEKENKRRLVRAIEVCKVTGKLFWEQRKMRDPVVNSLLIGLRFPQQELKERIWKRTERMFKAGLEKEVRTLVKEYGWIPSVETIGYKEWKEYFEEKIDKDKVKELINLHTVQFSKRQMTWFKRDDRINWIENYNKAQKLINNFLK